MPTTDIGQSLKEETFSEVDEKMVRPPDKDRTLSTSEGTLDEVIQNPEYLRYLELRGTFCGKRLDKLIRKVDLRVLPQLVIIYLMSYVDRSNVSNAKLFGMLADLGLSSQDWNVCLSIFFITYAAGATPSNIALKYFGPKIWLPTLLSLVSLMLVGTGLVNNYAGMAALRVLLGLFEAGVFPGCSFVLTAWYEPGELYRRMAIFYSGASAAGAFSGLLAYGIGQLDGTWGYRGWRFIYVIEGVFTLLCALSGFYFIYDTPAKVKWLSDEEREFLLLRAKFSAGGESGVAEETTFSWKHAGMAMKSFHIYACALIEFTCCVAVYGYSFVLPSIINDLGFSAANAQAMTVPPYVFACIVTIFSGWIGDKYRKRMLLVLGLNVAALIGLVIIMVSVRYTNLVGVTLFGVFITTAGLYPISPAVTAWISLNCAGSMKRAVGIGAMISFSQLGGIVGSNIYIGNQAPRYPVGFGVTIGMLVVFGCLWPIIYYFLLRRTNAKRESLSVEEIKARYTEEQLADMGDLSPMFRYST